MEIIVKNYEHFNRSFSKWDSPKGKWINSKKAYLEAMAREGMIPSDQANEIAEKARQTSFKPYDGISKKAHVLLSSVNKQKNGKIKLSEKQIEGLKEVGAKIELPDWCPKRLIAGGFLDGE